MCHSDAILMKIMMIKDVKAVIIVKVGGIFETVGSKPGHWIVENNKLCGNQRVDV